MRTKAASTLLIVCVSCASPPTPYDPTDSTIEELQSSELLVVQQQIPKTHLQEKECPVIQNVVREVRQTKITTDCILVYLQDEKAQQQEPSLQNWTQPTLQDYELMDCRSRVPGAENVNEAKPAEVIGER